MIPWHRLIGLTLEDFFSHSSYRVELEIDLSVKVQLLDVLIIQQKQEIKIKNKTPEFLPDGLENLSPYNLLTYKSHREALDNWTIDELIGHYVNYRKKISPSFKKLLPETDFRLFAVSTRFPEKLAKQIKLNEIGQGIYNIKWGHRNIRIIVLSQIAKSPNNALWLMFSAVPDKMEYGAKQFKWKTQVSSIMNRLFDKYNIEGVTMSYSIKEYLRETKEEVIGSLTKQDIDKILKTLRPEDRLRGLRPEDRLRGLRPEEVLGRFRAEERLRGLRPEEVLGRFRAEERLKGLRPEEVLEKFDYEEIEKYLRKNKGRLKGSRN